MKAIVTLASISLFLSGCALNQQEGGGSVLPRNLEPGANYELRVFNQTPCPLRVIMGPASRGGRLLLGGATAGEIAEVSPFENRNLNAVPEEGDQIYLVLPVGYNAVGTPCDPEHHRPYIRVLSVNRQRSANRENAGSGTVNPA